MNPWYAKAVVLAGTIVMVAIRAPHGQRSRAAKVVKDLKGRLEKALLAFVSVGFILPLVWVVAPIFAFADYDLRPAPLIVGTLLIVMGLWLFYRSHADLGTNWSISLEVRERHRLVSGGIYRRVRHPMYLSLFLYSLGQILVVPNWLVGPSYLVPFALLFALRVGREERMMQQEFGEAYDAYMARTKRLVPGLW